MRTKNKANPDDEKAATPATGEERRIIREADRDAQSSDLTIGGADVQVGSAETHSQQQSEMHHDGDDSGVKGRRTRQHTTAELGVIGAVTVDGAGMAVDEERKVGPRYCITCGTRIEQTGWLDCVYPLGSGPAPWEPPVWDKKRDRYWCQCEACTENKLRFYGFGVNKGRPRKYCSRACGRKEQSRRQREQRAANRTVRGE